MVAIVGDQDMGDHLRPRQATLGKEGIGARTIVSQPGRLAMTSRAQPLEEEIGNQLMPPRPTRTR